MRLIAAVTGAGGFVGGRLAANLAAGGWDVFALTARPTRVPRDPRIVTVECAWDAPEWETSLRSLQEVSLWIHAAARLDFDDRDVMGLYRDNALLTGRLCEAVRQLSADARFVYLSTLGMYAPDQPLSIDVEPQPRSHYALSKLIGERLCLAILGARCLVLRLHGVWGLGQDVTPRLFINRCLRSARAGQPIERIGSGDGRRNFIWAGDMATVVTHAVEAGWSGVHAVGSTEILSNREMVAAIAEQWTVPIRSLPSATDGIDPDRIAPVPADLPATPFRKALEVEARLS